MHLELEALLDRYQGPLILAVLIPLLLLETYRPLAPGRRGRLVHGLRHVGIFALGTVLFGVLVTSARPGGGRGPPGPVFRNLSNCWTSL